MLIRGSQEALKRKAQRTASSAFIQRAWDRATSVSTPTQSQGPQVVSIKGSDSQGYSVEWVTVKRSGLICSWYKCKGKLMGPALRHKESGLLYCVSCARFATRGTQKPVGRPRLCKVCSDPGPDSKTPWCSDHSRTIWEPIINALQEAKAHSVQEQMSDVQALEDSSDGAKTQSFASLTKAKATDERIA